MEEYNSQLFLLSSVNIILESIGELPLENEEDVDAILEARIARSSLIEAKLEVLSMGWDINTDDGYTFYPDTNGFISIPTTVLDIRSGDNIVVRDWQLYDKANFTRKFTEPVQCDVKWNLDFNSLPHPIRYYITIKAARRMQGRNIGDSNAYSFTQQDEQSALIAARNSEGYTGQYNVLSGDFSAQFNILGN
jgi:hypothetical protein